MKHLIAGACALALGAVPAASADLVYGSWLGANNATNTQAIAPYLEMVSKATGGSVNWTLVAGGQLAGGPATPEAVGSNLMDAGLVMAPYQPSMLPATNMIFSQSLLGDDLLASVGAMNETVMLNCPACLEEYRRNDAVGFAGYGVSPYLFMCRGEPRTLADLKGKKIRGSGGGVNIIELAGATPVSMPPSDATSALERGTIDCVLGSVQWLIGFGYMDVVDTVISAPMGMGGPPIMMYVNRAVWEGLTPAERKAHIDLAPDLITMTEFDAQIADDQRAKDQGAAKGIAFVEGGPDFDAVMQQRDGIQYGLNVEAAKAAGVEDAAAILDAYLASYERWKGIIADEVGDDRVKFREALWREVYSKVDPEKL